MIYSTGTISIKGNTATGSGTNWTAPASQVRAGQTIIVMSNPVQLFQISSVNSATSMTVTPAASPALSGQKYAILVSDIISVDGLAQAMSQLIKEYDENIGAWETFATTSANQSITVTINGTTVTIPGIGKLAQKGSNGAVTVADGGTGATNAADARTNLGLGEAAKRNVGTGENQIPDMASFASGDGWMKLPNGKILQYGRGEAMPKLSTQTMRITFPIPFPKKADIAILTHSGDGGAPFGAGRGFVMSVEGPTLTGFNSAYRTASTSDKVSMIYSWWAVGE
ncbi:hypothetical protein EC3003_4583 [Escherichia coli 3003]|nr:hypothetical protein EC3003_4583 [Escherichia coli 3003]